jgi:hypothetical protein
MTQVRNVIETIVVFYWQSFWHQMLIKVPPQWFQKQIAPPLDSMRVMKMQTIIDFEL